MKKKTSQAEIEKILDDTAARVLKEEKDALAKLEQGKKKPTIVEKVIEKKEK